MRIALLVLALVGAILVPLSAQLTANPTVQPAVLSSAQSATSQPQNEPCTSLPTPAPVDPPSTVGQGGGGGTAVSFGVYEAVVVDRSQVFTNYDGPPRCDGVVWVRSADGTTSSPMTLDDINAVFVGLDLGADWSDNQRHSLSG